MLEVEREPSPTPRHSKLVDSVDKAHDHEDEKTAKTRSSWLLTYAFGAQMLLGEDEWAHVAGVIRSSFLVVAKELKRHERRLRVLEFNSSSSQQQQWDESERWTAMQTQMTRFSDELQSLTQELQQLKESGAATHKQLKQQQAAVEKASKRSDERHARVKSRLASIELQIKSVVERDSSTLTRLQKVEGKLSAFTTELRQLGSDIGNSTQSDILKAQAQCEHEIRLLQRALMVHDKRSAAQLQAIEKRIANMTATTRGGKNPDAVATRAKAPLPGDEAVASDRPVPTLLLRTLASERIPVGNSKTKVPETQIPEVSTIGLHATLRERFARAREKQQESLNQLRHQQLHS